MNNIEKSESALFEWLADSQGDIGLICETHPRLSRLIDDYIVLLNAIDGLDSQAASDRHEYSNQVSAKTYLIKKIVAAHRQKA